MRLQSEVLSLSVISKLSKECFIHFPSSMAYDHDHGAAITVNPLTHRSDRYVNSLYIVNTVSNRQVMRMKKIIK